jgi:dTDP-4-dehydrorhamnose reductase
MKVLITGSRGMLGTAISEQLEKHDLYTYDINDFDITCPFKMDKIIKQLRPDYIINCAAYTAVDLAETEQEKAFTINATAVQKLSQIAQQYGSTLIHFSTDYVFDGNATAPYKPDHALDPVNAYGASKLVGEQAITNTGGAHYVFRISWLYAPYGKNFFRWVATSNQDTLSIVNSQTGSPTSALDVAHFIEHLIDNDPKVYGIYHFTNKGSWTWHDFASSINEKLKLGKHIKPVASFKTAAVRPSYSVMDTTITESVFNYNINDIELGLDTVIKNYPSK